MKIGLRLFLALTLVSVLVLLSSAIITRWNFQNSFVRYVEAQQTQRLERVARNLGEVYEADAGWDELAMNSRHWQALLRGSNVRGRPPRGRRGDRDRRPPPPDRFERHPEQGPERGRPEARLGLLDANGKHIAGWRPRGKAARRLEVNVDGDVVGFVVQRPAPPLSAKLDRQFSRKQLMSLWLTTAFALTLAALISALLARQLTRPIRALTGGVNAIAKGEYEHRADESRHDELGVMARQFNRLAESLQQSRMARKQWVADIAHELRTPLSVLRGEIEAIDDGVREFDASTRHSLLGEIERLTTLVGDLHQLSESDKGGLSYSTEHLDLCPVLKDVLQSHQARLQSAGLTLTWTLPGTEAFVIADEDRLRQLFANLVENSLRYTDLPGDLNVTCTRGAQDIHIAFEDSAPGVPAGSHEKLFERLYRVEASRNRGTGGAGLGLSICDAIVRGHGGRISASDSEHGGLAVLIVLPLANTVTNS